MTDKFAIVKYIAKEIVSRVNKKEFREINTFSSSDDRLYSYCESLTRCGSECFGSYLGSVYWYDGKRWVRFEKNDVLLELAVGEAMSVLDVPKKDILRGRSKMVSAIRSGSFLSPLDVRPTLVGFSNGVWDFSNIDKPKCYSYKDRMPIMDYLPYKYDPEAKCPVWTCFLEMVLTREQISTLQKYLGLGCIDRKTMSKKIEETLWLVGDGGNGKSTIFEVVKAVFGAFNLSFMPLDHLVTTNVDLRMRNIGKIAGKVFNYCSEIQASDISKSSDTFKSLCSGEPQEVRGIGKDSWTVDDIPFFIFNMNKMPSNSSMDKAFVRRLLVLEFDTTVKAEDMDRELASKLMKELPGIRNWVMDGLRALQRDAWNFGISKRDKEILRAYELENGMSVKVFCEDKGYRAKRYAGAWDEKPHYIDSSNLYREYLDYCAKNNIEPDTLNAFGRRMTGLKYGKEKSCGLMVYKIFCDVPIPGELRI